MAKREYIDREAARLAYEKSLANNNHRIEGASAIHRQEHRHILHILEKLPAADVVEVRHGYWIPSPDGINPIRCSECNMPAPFVAGENEFGDFEICRYPSKYCHECGAKMDGERKDKP